ncbi:MAG: glycosyltransferase [Candidatus Aureabacteria bacterium]|nr:glycosyltransferase [Candidatus Auribacterota bacterium]
MKIVVLVHGYPPTAVAGTEICAQRLCVALRNAGHGVTVMTREEFPGAPEYKVIRDTQDGVPVIRVVNNFTKLREAYRYEEHPRIEEIFGKLIAGTAPDLVHIQHLAGASWRIPAMVKERGIPLVISLHDYWYPCERVQLLRPDGTICPGPDEGRNCARYCAHGALSYMASAVMERIRWRTGFTGRFPAEAVVLKSLAAIQGGVMPRKTRRLAGVYGGRCARLLGGLAAADLLIAPSEKARSIYLSLGLPPAKVVVIPHGAPPFPPPGERAPYDGNRPLVVGYVGTIMPHKGVATFLRATRGFRPSVVTVRMFGRAYPKGFARYVQRIVARFPRGQVEMQGTYRPVELPRILSGLDLLVIPSLWHETFNLVLWEAWAARLPVVASRVGALGDVVRDGVDGFTFVPGDWRELRAKLGWIAANPRLLSEIRNHLPRNCISLEENARMYEEAYAALVAHRT